MKRELSRPGYGYKGQKLPSHVKEGIKQMFLVEPNKSLIARTFGVNLSTVYRTLGKEDPEVVREKRREAMARVAGKISEHVEQMVDNITPPDDASYMQKMTGFGIAVDKLVNLDKRLDEQQKDAKVESGEMLALPEDVESIMGLIRNDMRGLSVLLGVQFASPQARDVEAEIVDAQAEEILQLADLDVGAADDENRTADADSQGSHPSDANGHAVD